LLIIRRALLINRFICFAADELFTTTVRPPQLQEAIASLLYVNAVSLLDDAIMTRLQGSEKKLNRKERLKLLQARGDLLDFAAPDRFRERRNELAHEVGKEATSAELDDACDRIQKQLVAWGLVSDGQPYTIGWEQGAVRASTDPGASFERDQIVRVFEARARTIHH
jgi:hypothetical protein